MSFIEIDYLLCKRNASSHTIQKHPSREIGKGVYAANLQENTYVEVSF